jgi:RNA polymerase sigma-70 factor (ECF subfamily)
VKEQLDDAGDFEPHRKLLAGLAYRMLGSVAEAEDVVQDAFLRWREVDRATVEEPRAYLMRIVSRLCLDRLGAAHRRREQYVGTWLPEPVVAEPAQQLADDLSVALLLSLERLSPLERAAFLLHDVFDMDYAAVAATLESNEPACRQLAARARGHVRQEQPRYPATDDRARQLADAFAMAAATGNLEQLSRMLAQDAVLYTDGGGKRRAALKPIVGSERIVRFYQGTLKKGSALEGARAEPVMLNGLAGFVVRGQEGVETIAFEVSSEGLIVAIYSVRNPEKLEHLG